MKHYLVTRFNIVVPEWGITTDLQWFRERVRLFREICYPSVLQQTCQDFEWIVMFDYKTDYDLSEFDRITPLMIRENWLLELQDYLGHGLKLTTRLDSDDALRLDTVAVLQERSVMGWNNLTYGYVKDEAGRLWMKVDSANQFLSLKERSNKTALCMEHGAVRKIGANQIDDGAYWLHVQHGGNVVKHENYYKMARIHTELREFGQ